MDTWLEKWKTLQEYLGLVTISYRVGVHTFPLLAMLSIDSRRQDSKNFDLRFAMTNCYTGSIIIAVSRRKPSSTFKCDICPKTLKSLWTDAELVLVSVGHFMWTVSFF